MFRVFPAPAGINRLPAHANVKRYRVPRASGDKPIPRLLTPKLVRCSPRQRG